MKYGDTLRQRSIPEWGHFNIDYDYLKDLIKNQTTPGAGKALSIPGQGEPTEKAFGETFFKVLKAQHDRINLFIKSKSGEIERRLDHISRELLQLQARQAPGTRLPARTIEKYAKIDADRRSANIGRAGEEIRSLSRFRVAQRTGFHKILKKYKRWTRDRDLEHRFKEDVTEQPDSFFQLDLGILLDQYIEVLSALRAPFDAPRILTSPGEAAKGPTSATLDDNVKPPLRLTKAIEDGSELDFDVSLATTPLGAQGSKATYWIHPDHIVEVEVLLLQHMRLYIAIKSSNSPQDASVRPSPVRRKSSATSDKYFGNEDGIGSVFLDDPESFAIKQNAGTVGSSEEGVGTCNVRSTGTARWTSSGEAAVVVGLQAEDPDSVCAARLKRKHLASLFEQSTTSRSREDSAVNGRGEHSVDAVLDDTAIVKEWLSKHVDIRPMAGLFAKRTRLVGLHNGLGGGLWATLDRDILMKDLLQTHPNVNDWVSEVREGASEFPHSVLEIRREGNQSLELLHLLDRSHLLQRVRGFSLETQAVWTCCRPEAMSTPLWIPLLDEDIRKLPTPVKRQRRTAGSRSDSVSQLSPRTETSTTSASATGGHTSPYTLRNGESSATSGPDPLQPPPLRAFRHKSRRSYSKYPPPLQAEEARTQGYWNEYDNPESDEDGYYIYVDPNASVKFPGQEIIAEWTRKTKDFFLGKKKSGDESPILTSAEDGSTDDEDGDETADETRSSASLIKRYGAIHRPAKPRQQDGEGYFSGLFRTRDPHRDVDVLSTMRRHSERERQNLLTEIHTRQHEREMTKMRFYTTCLAAAIVIDVILSTLTITSRRKERGIVDGVILFGTISNLLLLTVAVLSMRTRHERLGWIHHTLVYIVAVAVVTMDILLLRWVLSP
ncbi:hypothetical protein BCR34DRAFT_496053 [Clohesyomyces aquaticus]|uniref:SPX domain-containing protein n=1 Tax=Clohesyomyces aquaticus TaxID=1231657 RepID=A0A1Y1YKH6_9PLEO|nr:hypothetical protein BCR34DRAFT_496053 [Clohesyomyces aquaticus]